MSGLGGMVGGQMLDLAAEGRFDGQMKKLGEQDILTLQAMKTGALIRFGCVAGAMLGEADDKQYAALNRYGEIVGQAFQIADDLLDIEGDAATLGKAAQKDAAAGKGTIASLLGVEKARARLKALVEEAGTVLAPFGAKADILKTAAKFVAERKA
jgi:farnesyl diphosphate synthase